MAIEKKNWGTSELLYADSTVELRRITVLPGGFCSRHCHMKKDNLFFLLEGRLVIKRFFDGVANPVELSVGETEVVKAKTVHQFYATGGPSGAGAVAIELYAPARGELVNVSLDDIIRYSVGGQTT